MANKLGLLQRLISWSQPSSELQRACRPLMLNGNKYYRQAMPRSCVCFMTPTSCTCCICNSVTANVHACLREDTICQVYYPSMDLHGHFASVYWHMLHDESYTDSVAH